MSKLLVGLTGGLASGKSTVARRLGEAGCTVIDADAVVADLYRPGAPGSQAVEELFGSEILTPDGAVDRPKVARKVFGDEVARRLLEAAIHPLVRQRTAQLLAAADGIVIYEATLLVEAGRAGDFDTVISVEADPERRLHRAVRRGMEEAETQARLVAQGDGETRRARADRILVNDGTLEDLERAIAELHRELQIELDRRRSAEGAS